jgi:dTMP kinase
VPFITFEGVEGCGKSTQLRLLAERLRGLGLDVRATREPGGTPLGEELRAILMDPAQPSLDPIAEWLLFEADRRQHVVDVILPALQSGAWVLGDRFSDSTQAYQAAGRGLDADLIALVDQRVCGGISPDLTLLYDLEVLEGLARARRRDAQEGRFEAEELAFHEKVRLGFREIARREPQRVAVVPAHGDPDAIFAETWRTVTERFPL